MKVVLEGEQSKSVTVESGVTQSWNLMFLCHINDLPYRNENVAAPELQYCNSRAAIKV